MFNTIDPRTVLSFSISQAPKADQKAQDLKQLRETTREFESIYVMEMYKAMRKAVPEGGLIEKSSSQEMYEEMFDMKMAKETAAGPGMGLGEAMYQQLAEVIEKRKE